MFLNAEPINGFAETGVGGTYNPAKAVHANVASPYFDPGLICKYWNNDIHGYGACAYLLYNQESASAAAGAGTLCTMVAGADYEVTNDASAGAVGDATGEGGVPACVAVMTMTDGYYGWFWIAGVPPYFMTSATAKFSASNLTSGGSIVAMSPFIASTTDGAIALYNNDGSADSIPIGMSNAADDANNHVAIDAVRLFGVGWGL